MARPDYVGLALLGIGGLVVWKNWSIIGPKLGFSGVAGTVPGTGLTVAELKAKGYTDDQINQLVNPSSQVLNNIQVPGTGQSVGDLIGAGWSMSEIVGMIQNAANQVYLNAGMLNPPIQTSQGS
jgi:hypothetical protein